MSVNIKSDQSGFTLTELIVAIGAGAVVALAVLSVSLFFVADIFRASATTTMSIEAQNMLRVVVDDMREGTSILATNNLPDVNAPTGGWNTSNADVVLIVSLPATDNNNEHILDDSAGELYQNEIIYYADEGVLWKRVLANSMATGNTSITSCPAAIATATCPSDRLVGEDYKSMVFDFYDQDNVLTTDPLLARSVGINIVLEQQIYGNTVTFDNAIRITLRNPN